MRPPGRALGDGAVRKLRHVSTWIWLVPLVSLLAAGCRVNPGGSSEPARRLVALVGGRVQPSPEGSAIPDGIVLVEGGVIAAVGHRREVRVPPDSAILDCSGATVSASFWNSHVHFTGPAWHRADAAAADSLARELRAMTTSYGFTHVLDTGSWLPNTLALRRRIESGEIPGPYIMTTGTGLAPAQGSPFYILPVRLPELAQASDAAPLIDPQLDAGADLVKLFTGSWAREGVVVVMPVDVVRAAVTVAHRRGKLVVAHPSNSAGASAALEGGVDILAHTFPSELDGPWDRSLPGRIRERQMALIPTLKLWPFEMRKLGMSPDVANRLLANGQAQVRALVDIGGQVLFGTDVGYMTDYDPTDEYVFLQGAGLSYARILTALTTAPAERFGAAARTGRLAPGMDADIVVINGDPERDIRALANVRYTLRKGRVIYEKSS
jgi:imidazolonepropionase-like amidohydrolase